MLNMTTIRKARKSVFLRIMTAEHMVEEIVALRWRRRSTRNPEELAKIGKVVGDLSTELRALSNRTVNLMLAIDLACDIVAEEIRGRLADKNRRN